MNENTNTQNYTSRTITITQDENQTEQLNLSIQAESTGSRVRWDQTVIDNEGMGKKKSKVCCIYKKERQLGESSSEDSDSDEEFHYKGKDIGSPNNYERVPKPKKKGHSHQCKK